MPRLGTRLRRRRLCSIASGLLLVSAVTGGAPTSALADHQQQAMFLDTAGTLADPVARLSELRGLGVERMRLFVAWRAYAPQPLSLVRPRGFNAASPAAYPAGAWSRLDAAVQQAEANGIDLDLDVGGGSPLWATAPDRPRDRPHPNWAPNASDYGGFVRAVSTRYSGNYNPVTNTVSPGDPADLPAVHFWSIWNEPNYGPSLAPQGDPHEAGHSSVERSAWTYRNLLDAGWSALHATGHGGDTILFGEVAPRGGAGNRLGLFNGTRPMQFLRALYCVDSGYRLLRGRAATRRGCPATAAGSQAFRSRHPALFDASGFADHPYSRWFPPNVERMGSPDDTPLAQIGGLIRALDRMQRIYGSHARLPIWNTEYGYLTSPPKRRHPPLFTPTVSQTTAAYYLNWAEYISWRNPRIASTMQYLYGDPLPALATNDYGGYATGLVNFNGTKKPTYYAYRMPLYLPKTSARRGARLEVWGAARPAHFAMIDVPADPETVDVEFKPAGARSFAVVRTVTVTSPHGYFDTRVLFPSSGTVRLAWSYPTDDPLLTRNGRIYSRNVQIKLR
jgi:hypothetical protein